MKISSTAVREIRKGLKNSINTNMPSSNYITHPKTSRIIQLELRITEAIFHGHKPRGDDRFQEDREELKRLRKELAIPNHREQKYGHSKDQ